MGIKEKIKTNIQRNLDQRYFKRLLGIIATRPVLFAYGSTFSSVSDRYLNISSIESIRDAYNGNKPVGFGSIFLPYEFFNAIGVLPLLPEVMAGFTAGLGLSDQTIKKASARWYSQDLCTFHRSASGAVELDLFPRPDFIVCTNLACDAAQKSFYHYAVNYNIQKHYYHLDVPYHYSVRSLKYLAGQLEELAEKIGDITGQKTDMGRFAEAIELSNEFRKWAIKLNNVRKELLIYPRYFNGLNFVLPFHAFPGTEQAVKLYKNIYLELNAFLQKQKKDPDIHKNPPKKILWLHLKPYYRNEIFDILENGNCRVVFEEINYVYWPELDPARPFESLALKMLTHPLRGKISNRTAAIGRMAEDYSIDGAILFTHWGCRQSNGGARIIKDYLKGRGFPLLVLDGDCVDRANSSTGQIKTRLQGYMEILNTG
jgi:benzoyl-CoA reductase/2-hydroxyglutaryl-CoA dehydratase subunit BcrC/BadD/HgdB